ncbi:hypothetical protein DFJ73DRAFT_956072 [Zopfochytrium polystomum]|nr:hypothetical protein DFJ73DRAFT_956072 [Zopfochytrium polystomum]
MARHGDPRFVRADDSHRAAMREMLYGSGRTVVPLGTTTRAVGAHYANYADETPPPGNRAGTTFAAAFPPKAVEQATRAEDAAFKGEHSNFIKESHFTIRGYGAEDAIETVTSHRRDFPRKSVKLERIAGPGSLYPPIFRDEQVAPKYNSEYGTQFETAHNAYPKHVVVDGTRSHFEFGNDDDEVTSPSALDTAKWSSITAKNFRPPRPSAHTKARAVFERAENKQSTAVGSVDGEKVEMRSTQARDFSMVPDLDWSSLTVDNTQTVKDLKSTHFTLGTLRTPQFASQYQSSYVTPPPRTRTPKPTHAPSSIHFDPDDGPTPSSPATSTTFRRRNDYPDPAGHTGSLARDSRRTAAALKHSQTASAIPLDGPASESAEGAAGTRSCGGDAAGWPPRRSVSHAAYPPPNPPARPHRPPPQPRSDPVADPDGPRRIAAASASRDAFPAYVATADDTSSGGVEPAVAAGVRDAFRERAALRDEAKVFIAAHHFALRGGAADGRGLSGVGDGTPGLARASEGWGRAVMAAGTPRRVVPVQTRDLGFASTLGNTVTRYPMASDTFGSVTATSYKRHPPSAAAAAAAIPAAGAAAGAVDQRSDHHATAADRLGLLMSCQCDDDENSAGGSGGCTGAPSATETRRAFVPPEVMRVMQGPRGVRTQAGVAGGNEGVLVLV